MMIAHRLETAITFSDKIIVMDKGQVVECDNSFALLEKCPDKIIEAHQKCLSSEFEACLPTTPTTDTLFANMVRALPL